MKPTEAIRKAIQIIAKDINKEVQELQKEILNDDIQPITRMEKDIYLIGYTAALKEVIKGLLDQAQPEPTEEPEEPTETTEDIKYKLSTAVLFGCILAFSLLYLLGVTIAII